MEGNQQLGSKSPRAVEILKRVQGTNKIVPVEPPKQEVTPAAPPVEVKTEPEYDINPPTAPVKEEVKAEEKKDPIPREYLPDDPTDEVDQLIDPKDTTGANFKKLRTKLKAVNQENRTNKEELEVLRKKVSDYENGLAVPEITQQQRDRIAELEKYEKLHNFKGSPAYVKKFAEPIRQEQEKLLELAKEYEVDPEILNKAFAASNVAETNKILSQNFKDDVGALEVKSIFNSIKKIQNEALAAEKEIETSFTRMQQESEAIVAEQRQRANQVIVNVSKEAWTDSLVELRKDTRFPEITYREGDTEHNEKYVRPILTKAGQEYGRIVSVLAKHGLTELPKDLSLALARMTQLAHLSAVTAVQRDALVARVAELEGVLNRQKSFNRPSVNGTGGGNNTVGTSIKAVGPQNAARRVLERVTGK